MIKQFLFTVSALLLVAVTAAQSANLTYLCLGNGDIVLADVGNCTSTVVATAPQSLFDIAQGDTNDTLYGIRNEELFEINVTTGIVSSLGNLAVQGFTGVFRVDSLVKESNGTLLGVSTNLPGELFRIDVATLTATNLGNVGFASAGDLTFLNGTLYLSADNNELVEVVIANPPNSVLIGTIAGGTGFNNVFGVVTIITSNPCSATPTFDLIATGGDDTRFIDPITAQTTVNCTNLTGATIFGAAEVASDVLCSFIIDIEDLTQMTSTPEYCGNANTTLEVTADPVMPLGTYTYEWRVAGTTPVIGTNATLPISINTTTTYECTITDTGRAAPDDMAVSTIDVVVNAQPVSPVFMDVVAFSSYDLPAFTAANFPANTAFYLDNTYTGTAYNQGDTITPALLATNPATIFLYGIDANGCTVESSFLLEFVDVQLNITPGGIQDICAGDAVTLTVTPSPATAYGTYTYNWTDSQGTTYPNSATITVNPTVNTTISVTVDDSGVVNGVDMGFDMTDINVLPAVDIIALTDQTATGSFTFPAITGSGLTGGERYYTQPNGMGTAYDAGDMVNTSTFTSFPVRLYIYDANSSCNDEESFLLDITLVMFTVQVTATDTDICDGENTTISAMPDPLVAQGIYTYEWTIQGSTNIIATSQNITVNPAVSTTYECTVTDTGISTNNTRTASILINVNPTPDLDPIPNQNSISSFTFPTINGTNLSGNEAYYTQPNGMGTRYDALDIVDASAFSSYPVRLYAYDNTTAGCDDEVSFTLIIDVPVVPIPDPVELIIPQYFTPNADGFHDFWKVDKTSDRIDIKTIYIFNRYGKLLKQLATDGIGWDGTYNDNLLPSSSYWYSITYSIDDVSQEATGFFVLKR